MARFVLAHIEIHLHQDLLVLFLKEGILQMPVVRTPFPRDLHVSWGSVHAVSVGPPHDDECSVWSKLINIRCRASAVKCDRHKVQLLEPEC